MVLGKMLEVSQVTLPSAVLTEADIQAHDTVAFEVTGPGVVEIRRLPRLRLVEALERYRIEGPIDERMDRPAWVAEAASHVLGGQPE